MMEKVEVLSWRGYRIVIVNVPFPWISDIGAMMCQTDPERTIAVVWNKPATGPYSVSLRSHNPLGPNIEQIALEFKGGGHVHGAGLRTEIPPYELFNDNNKK
jgi:oligoribonuclease NrnB/cAMP/cGMP phosphodiesterase (DHH superfamily)